ncbi:MAG TPA: DUF2851 family protein, partial [Cytophagaceae bacterium]
MKEDFLHFLWELQYFNKNSLTTSSGEEINVLHPGHRNKNSGPDFSQAKLIINGIEWHGHVEIHINSSDWYQHHHDQDAAYENVILHVVWSHDKEVYRMDGSLLPTLTLSDKTDILLTEKYLNFVNSKWEIPCKNQLPSVSDIQKISMIERALMNRLENKS